jgi:catechol 2,3-dioxygenase-like lactoylglutathione lyase family enzyme
MEKLYARGVFFTKDAEHSLRFYTEQLGFTTDWSFQEEGRTVVFQVSLFGFEIILNQTDDKTEARAGHGRVFIGLEDDQGQPLREHFVGKDIKVERISWGRPTLVMKDVDGNEIFFWLPHNDFTGFGV